MEDEAVHDAVDPEASNWVEDWSSLAACSTTDPDELFVQGTAQNRAKLVCAGCLVRTECLADALDNRVEFGVWGGMTERERRALLRRRPTVTSWRRLLQTARTQYEQAVTVDAAPAPSGEMGEVVDKALEWTA
ncbi:WhiB family transcriptional regulator [Streptomyces californicus]|uniref:WhiB family transcriptional regulator n=1 Tax=Streptomyces californicus TaxID=67351 RepID=UPI0033C6E8FA